MPDRAPLTYRVYKWLVIIPFLALSAALIGLAVTALSYLGAPTFESRRQTLVFGAPISTRGHSSDDLISLMDMSRTDILAQLGQSAEHFTSTSQATRQPRPSQSSKEPLLFLFAAALAWLGGLALVRFSNRFEGLTHRFYTPLLALEFVRLLGISKANNRRPRGYIALIRVLTWHTSPLYDQPNRWFTFLVYAYTMPLGLVQAGAPSP